MANLLIGYPDIPFRANVIASSSAATGYPAENSILGPRGLHYKLAAAGTTLSVDLDLGGSTTAKPGYAIVARADLVAKRDSAATTLQIKGADDTAFSVNLETKSTTFTSSSCLGSRLEDFVYLPSSFTNNHRYWRWLIGTTAAFQIDVSKVYLGTFFDFAKEPVYPVTMQRAAKDQWNRDGPRTFSLTWKGLSDTTRNSFVTTLYQYRDISPVFLYEASGTYVLRGETCVHAWIKKAVITEDQPNTNSIVVDFEECL